MGKKVFQSVIVLWVLLLAVSISFAAAPYFEGKTIRLIVGYTAGGGFDTYSRLIGRHLGKHIPGNPTVIVDNMPGGGSMIAAKQVYSRAKPDGLTIANVTSQLILAQMLGREGMDIDMRKFEYLGVPVADNVVCAFNKVCGITNFKDWMGSKTPVKIGGDAPGSVPADTPKILKAALDLPIHLVEGYKGTNEIRMAADTGEVCGGCWQWESIKVIWAKGLSTGDVNVLIQATDKPLPDLPNVPLAVNIAKTDEGRQLIRAAISEPGSITRLYCLAPETPKDRVQILQKAFMDTMHDKDLLEEAGKAKLAIDPMPGDEVAKIVNGLFGLNPTVLAKLKEILHPKK
jgi:tripartite-type tricarboxylate transporter receptor subunit TctC